MREEAKISGETEFGLLNIVHNKLENIFFIWSQISQPHMLHISASQLHEHILPEVDSIGYQ